MNGILQDGVLAFLTAVGLVTVVRLLAAALLHTGQMEIPGLLLVLPVQEEAPAMEADMRQLRCLQRQLPDSRIVLLDCGLSAEARALALYLAERGENARILDEIKKEDVWKS